MEDEYVLVEADEAIKILGISRSNFFTKVNKGEIEKIIEPHKTRGAKYRIKQPTNAQKSTQEVTVFRRARPEDAQAMYQLGEKIMKPQGGYGIKPEKLIPYLSMPNSEIGHVLIKNKQLAGYFTIVPLTHKQLIQRMKDEVYIADFPTNELPEFQPGKPIDCFVWEIMAENKETGRYIISKMLQFFHSLGKRGVEIEGVYTIASTVEGRTLANAMGMKLMNLPEVTAPDYLPLELKIQENINWITKKYILALRSYQRRKEKMQQHTLTLLDKDQEEE